MRDRLAYEFGDWRFEPHNARLVGPDETVPLTAKATDTLHVLVRHANQLVAKDELIAAIWPGVAVEENNLNQQISALRRALGNGAGPVVIETVPRRGYRLVGPVRVAPEPVMSAWSESAMGAESGGATAAPVRVSRVWLGAGLVAVVAAAAAALASLPTPWSAATPTDDAQHRSRVARERGDELQREGNPKAAIQVLQEAIRLDPGNARAYGSLAHALQGASRATPTTAVRPAGQSPSVQAAARGAELDPECGECQGTYGFFLFYHDWKFRAAEDRFRSAVRLSPDQEAIRPSYAMLLAATGRPREALEQIDFALERNPYHATWLVIRASILYHSRRYEDAISTADRALLIVGHDRGAWDWRSKALFQLGRGQEAIHALAQDLFAGQSVSLEQALSAGGPTAGLRTALELTGDWRGRVEESWRRAAWRALLHDTDGALDELERALQSRRFSVINLGVDPVFDGIRHDPRFVAMLSALELDAWFPDAELSGSRSPKH